MRSTIDWNEIVPRLKDKGLRDTLFMEAIMMLSDVAPRALPVRTHVNRRGKPQRTWGAEGDGKRLNGIGRYYRINKNAERTPTIGKLGEIWRKLIAIKDDVIPYETFAAIVKSSKGETASTICQLWERHFIDTATPPAADKKKVGQAY